MMGKVHGPHEVLFALDGHLGIVAGSGVAETHLEGVALTGFAADCHA